jgi:hypothetical protein
MNTELLCPNCRQPLSDSDTICPGCRTLLSGAAAPLPPPPELPRVDGYRLEGVLGEGGMGPAQAAPGNCRWAAPSR